MNKAVLSLQATIKASMCEKKEVSWVSSMRTDKLYIARVKYAYNQIYLRIGLRVSLEEIHESRIKGECAFRVSLSFR